MRTRRKTTQDEGKQVSDDRASQTTAPAYRTPSEIIARTIAVTRDTDGNLMVGKATRKKAEAVLVALHAEGFRVVR